MTSVPEHDDDNSEEMDAPRIEVPISASMSDLFAAAYAHPDGEHIDDEIVDELQEFLPVHIIDDQKKASAE